MRRKILLMGLPGAGKTTLAKALAPRINAVHLDADEVRQHLNKDLGFSVEDRVEQARRMGWLCDRIVESGGFAIADFVCPTPEARAAFVEGGGAYIVWLDRIKSGRFEDTNRLFIPPEAVGTRVEAERSPEYWAEKVAMDVRPIFDWKKPTALFVGRYQPFHDGHKTIILEGLRRVGQACVAVRDTASTDASNPYAFEYVRARIDYALRAQEGRYVVVQIPNISHIFYGRDVGYMIERIDVDTEIASISATGIRRQLDGP